MKIGIVGAGNIGTALTHVLTALGHDVAVANSRDPETLGELVRQTGARAVTAAEAPRGAQLVVSHRPAEERPRPARRPAGERRAGRRGRRHRQLLPAAA